MSLRKAIGISLSIIGGISYNNALGLKREIGQEYLERQEILSEESVKESRKFTNRSVGDISDIPALLIGLGASLAYLPDKKRKS